MSNFIKMKWETFDLKKSENPRKKTVVPLVRLLLRAAAPGLKTLRLPRARVRKCVCVYVCVCVCVCVSARMCVNAPLCT